MLAPTYPGNLDEVMFTLDRVDQQHRIKTLEYLVRSFAPFAPPKEASAISDTAIKLFAPITGSREPDGSTGVVDCVAQLPTEKGA